MERGHPEHSEAGREAVLKGQKFTNLDFFFLHQRPQTKPSSLRGSTWEVPPAVSPAPTDRDHPKNCLCSLLPTARGTGSCGAARSCRKPAQLSPPRPGWQLSDLLLIEGSAQSWANTETAPAPPAHTPHKAAGPGDVLRPQGISDFQAPGCRAATARFRWGFGARLPRRRDVAAGCWAAARGCSHDGSIAAGTQRGRSEMQQGKEASCSPQCPPQSRQNAALGFSVAALTLQVTFSKSVSCSDKHPKIPRPPKSWEQ